MLSCVWLAFGLSPCKTEHSLWWLVVPSLWEPWKYSVFLTVQTINVFSYLLIYPAHRLLDKWMNKLIQHGICPSRDRLKQKACLAFSSSPFGGQTLIWLQHMLPSAPLSPMSLTAKGTTLMTKYAYIACCGMVGSKFLGSIISSDWRGHYRKTNWKMSGGSQRERLSELCQEGPVRAWQRHWIVIPAVAFSGGGGQGERRSSGQV